jgi:2-keto-4-pentenoate hydratase
MLTDAKIEEAAEMLQRSRIDRAPLDRLPEDVRPTTLFEAYRIQRAYDQRSAEAVVGYKIGAASAASQKLVGATSPFLARIYASCCFESAVRFDVREFFLPGVEAEFAFEIGRDLPPRERPYQMEEIAQAIAAVRPVVEVCDNRFRDWRSADLMEIIADNGFFGALVVGKRFEDWNRHDLGNLEVIMRVNGVERRRARCQDVLGHPLDGVVWMANELSRQMNGLKRGYIVSIGTWTGLHFVARETKVSADFGELGEVSFEFD